MSDRTRERGKRPSREVPAISKMRSADAKRLKRAIKQFEALPFPVSIKLRQEAGRKWCISYHGDGQDAELIGQLRMHAAFGSMSQAFIDTIMTDLLDVWDNGRGITEKRYNAAIAVIEAAEPKNEVEAMLVVQMIAAHEAALRATAMIGESGMFPHVIAYGNLANKFMRTFAAQTEALAKLRRGGEQVVKYVHVHQGGQAVVADTVNQNGGRVDFETAEQPYGTKATSNGTALPSPNPAWNGVPIPGYAEREVSPARRQEPGSPQG